MAAAHRASSGFTLVELLVSLVILSMMATMLLGGIGTATTLGRRTGTAEDVLSEIAAAQAMLRHRIEGLRPLSRLDSADPAMDVGGEEQRFDFFAAPPLADPAGGIQKYRLLLTASGDLMLYRAPELTDHFDLRSPGVVGWKAIRVLQAVTSLSIGYFGATRTDPARKWRSFWRDNATAPEIVRIRVGFAPGDARDWPDLMIRPSVTVDLACDPEAARAACGSRP
jgi:general secretion pathway protein J